MKKDSFYISRICIDKLFNYKNIDWNLFEDVNILGGINGSGKSTILKLTYELLKNGFISSDLLNLVNDIKIWFNNSFYFTWEKEFVNSIDYVRQDGFEYLGNNRIENDGKIIIQKIRITDETGNICLFNDIKDKINVFFINSYEQKLLKDEEISTLDEDLKTYLDVLIYKQIYKRNSKLVTLYENYKTIFDENYLKKTITEKLKDNIYNDSELKKIKLLIKDSDSNEIDEDKIKPLIKDRLKLYVENTLKNLITQLSEDLSSVESQTLDIYTIIEEFYNPSVIVERTPSFTFKCKDGSVINFTHLSTGEKQLLLILLMVYNTENEECIFFMDEPDLSMHIDWKEKFIRTLRHINPNMQLIIATHAPSMVEGWFNNVKEVCEISQDIN